MAEAVYRQEGDVYHPTEWAGSPWSAQSQHGGPVNALMARAVAAAAGETGLTPVRLGVDLLGPVPMRPLLLQHRLAHRSRRTAFVDVRLSDGGRDVARATAQLLHASGEGARPRSYSQPERTLPGPEGLESIPMIPDKLREHLGPGFHLSFEVRVVPEQSSAWITTPLNLVEGEPIRDFERAAALADLTGGLIGRSQGLARAQPPDARRELFVNTDTHVHLERMPVGPWLGIEKLLLSDRDGIGNAMAWLHDEEGRFGTGQQSLLVRSS